MTRQLALLTLVAGLLLDQPASFAGEPEPARDAAMCEAPRPLVEVSYTTYAQAAADCVPRQQCCKVCAKGKACGNSCISRRYTCRKGPGCACDGHRVCK